MIPIYERKGGAAFRVKVIPRASQNEIGGRDGEMLRVRLNAPPIGGAANKALIRLLAEVLDLPERDIEIVSGHTGRQKLIWVASLSPGQVEARLRTRLPST